MIHSDKDYFAELADRLRADGMPEREVTATVADLSGYLAETGSPDAYEEFGAPETFAARLTQGRYAARPEPGAETWKWATDVYTDRKLLNHYGDQGWEVESLDRLGRFVCRRDPEAPMRWEYRREIANNANERASVTAGLASDGWEPCGHWMYFMYLKRPKAASAGPAAELEELIAAPDRRLFLSPRYRRQLKQFVGAAVVAGALSGLATYQGGDVAALPILIGAAIAAPIAFIAGWRRLKREVAAGIADE